jgi:hypothetical protein
MTMTPDQLYAALEQSASQVPYTVTRTVDGFRVELDLFTPEVRQRAQRLSFDRTFAISVRLDERKQKAKLTDTLKTLTWGPGYTSGFQVGTSIQKGSITESSYTFGGSDEDKARIQEMKPLAIKAARTWVREQLEDSGWKLGGIGAFFS